MDKCDLQCFLIRHFRAYAWSHPALLLVHLHSREFSSGALLVRVLKERLEPVMRRYLLVSLAFAAAALLGAGFLTTSRFFSPEAQAAGAYGKGAAFAKQTFKENRKKQAKMKNRNP
jgi:hypothetical protein